MFIDFTQLVTGSTVNRAYLFVCLFKWTTAQNSMFIGSHSWIVLNGQLLSSQCLLIPVWVATAGSVDTALIVGLN